jgi:DNA-binding NarL/FixJ family response regulator
VSDRTTVVLADDHAMMRDGIRSILENAESIEVVAEAENGREAVALASKHAPDVVLIDIGMPDLNGVEATRRIHTNDPKIAIIALSMHTTERYVMGMLDAGARGYLLKTCDSTELLRAIDAVQRGKVYVTADVTHVLLGRRQGDDRTGTPPPDVLTPREREVLQLIAEGLTSKEAASSVRRSRRSRPTAPTSFGSWTCTRSRS